MDLKQARQLAGMTQMELAEKAGIPQSHVSIIEQGKILPQTATRDRIENALGVKVDWLALRMQQPIRSDTFTDGESPEERILKAVKAFVKSASTKYERQHRMKFLKQVVQYYEDE